MILIQKIEAVELLRSGKIQKTIEAIKDYFSDSGSDISDADADEILALIIPGPVYKTLKDLIESGIDSHAECLKDALTKGERDRCDTISQSRICEALNRIKSFNKDRIPTEQLRQFWEAYRCA